MNPPSAKIPPKISGAESQIMEALWRCGPLTPDGTSMLAGLLKTTVLGKRQFVEAAE